LQATKDTAAPASRAGGKENLAAAAGDGDDAEEFEIGLSKRSGRPIIHRNQTNVPPVTGSGRSCLVVPRPLLLLLLVLLMPQMASAAHASARVKLLTATAAVRTRAAAVGRMRGAAVRTTRAAAVRVTVRARGSLTHPQMKEKKMRLRRMTMAAAVRGTRSQTSRGILAVVVQHMYAHALAGR
jgi:hypothetical protein